MEETRSTVQKLGSFVSESMDSLEEGLGADIVLGDILLVCEFQRQEEDRSATTLVRYICSDDRPHIAIGLIRMAQLASEQQNG